MQVMRNQEFQWNESMFVGFKKVLTIMYSVRLK
jgi:hypothetical protein